jgi:hypothetical protein
MTFGYRLRGKQEFFVSVRQKSVLQRIDGQLWGQIALRAVWADFPT